jgi:hypothetical protein
MAMNDDYGVVTTNADAFTEYYIHKLLVYFNKLQTYSNYTVQKVFLRHPRCLFRGLFHALLPYP